MSTLAFEDLLEAARLGEGAALAELWSRHAQAVAAYVRGRGCDEVDEVTSDTFLAAFDLLDRFDGDEDGFRGLLHTIARRRVIDRHRHHQRRPQSSSWSWQDDDRTVEAAEDEVVGRLEQRELLDAVEALTADQRDVILLRLVSDLPLEQVARVTGKRVGTVKSLQRRGLDALRRALVRQDEAARSRPGPPGPRPAPCPTILDAQGER